MQRKSVTLSPGVSLNKIMGKALDQLSWCVITDLHATIVRAQLSLTMPTVPALSILNILVDNYLSIVFFVS